MEAGVIALTHICSDFFLLIVDMSKYLSGADGLPIGDNTVNFSINYDNSGTLVLVNTLPTQFTPRRKYYAYKTIWF